MRATRAARRQKSTCGERAAPPRAPCAARTPHCPPPRSTHAPLMNRSATAASSRARMSSPMTLWATRPAAWAAASAWRVMVSAAWRRCAMRASDCSDEDVGVPVQEDSATTAPPARSAAVLGSTSMTLLPPWRARRPRQARARTARSGAPRVRRRMAPYARRSRAAAAGQCARLPLLQVAVLPHEERVEEDAACAGAPARGLSTGSGGRRERGGDS